MAYAGEIEEGFCRKIFREMGPYEVDAGLYCRARDVVLMRMGWLLWWVVVGIEDVVESLFTEWGSVNEAA